MSATHMELAPDPSSAPAEPLGKPRRTWRSVWASFVEAVLALPAPLRVFLCILTVFALLLPAVLPWYYASKSSSSNVLVTYPNSLSKFTGIVANMQVQALQLPSPTLTVSTAFTPMGYAALSTWTGNEDDSDSLFLPPVNDTWKATAILMGINKNWVKGASLGDTLPRVVQNYAVKTETPYNSYPFDKYSVDIVIHGAFVINSAELGDDLQLIMVLQLQGILNTLSASNSGSSSVDLSQNQWLTPGPMGVKVSQTIMGYIVSASANLRDPGPAGSGTSNYTSIMVSLDIQRVETTKFFSIFAVIIMWMLSLSLFVVALDFVVVRPREVVPPLVAGVTAALFALPAVRNTQPGVPPIGAMVDIWGFFINMMLITIADALLIMKLAWQYQPPAKPAPKTV